jgi:hypothetical protein
VVSTIWQLIHVNNDKVNIRVKNLNMKPKVLYTQSTQLYWPTNWMNSTSSFLLEMVGCHTPKICVSGFSFSGMHIQNVHVPTAPLYVSVMFVQSVRHVCINMGSHMVCFLFGRVHLNWGFLSKCSSCTHIARLPLWMLLPRPAHSTPLSKMLLNVLWLAVWDHSVQNIYICWDGWIAYHFWPWIWTWNWYITRSPNTKQKRVCQHQYIYTHMHMWYIELNFGS